MNTIQRYFQNVSLTPGEVVDTVKKTGHLGLQELRNQKEFESPLFKTYQKIRLEVEIGSKDGKNDLPNT